MWYPRFAAMSTPPFSRTSYIPSLVSRPLPFSAAANSSSAFLIASSPRPRCLSLEMAVLISRGAKSLSIQWMSCDAAKCSVPRISHVRDILLLAMASSTSALVEPSQRRPMAQSAAG